MRGFSGHFPPFQLLYLWDLVLAYDSMEVTFSLLFFRHFSPQLFPLLAAAILSFRKENLLRVKDISRRTILHHVIICLSFYQPRPQVNTMVGVETVLADLSSLPIIPLLQLALARGSPH